MGATTSVVWAPPLPQRSLRDPAGVGPNNKHWVPGVSFFNGLGAGWQAECLAGPGASPRGPAEITRVPWWGFAPR
jgi:hypothetical protein